MGDKITIVDFLLYSCIALLEEVASPILIKDCEVPKLVEWYNRVGQIPSIIKETDKLKAEAPEHKKAINEGYQAFIKDREVK